MTAHCPNGMISQREAVERLSTGSVVAFPTETVFGLGADASNASAVERVYAMKGRPRNKPMPVIVADFAMAQNVTDGLVDRARRLGEAFWPGPLTMVCPVHPGIPGIVTSGGDTVAIRIPGLDSLRQLIQAVGHPLIAPSANRAGDEPARTNEGLQAIFAHELSTGQLACYMPPDTLTIAQEPSTIIIPGKNSGEDRVLRPGPISAQSLSEIG